MSYLDQYSMVKNKPKCPLCGKEMVLDDIDQNFEGSQDEYFMCCNEECHPTSSAIVEVRYYKPKKVTIYVDEKVVATEYPQRQDALDDFKDILKGKKP